LTSLHRRDHWQWLIPVLALLATAGYVAWTYTQGPLGFPLDDAWIHQTYARHLAEAGQLAYLPGQPSAGSTSPAWSFLLSVGYLLGVDYRPWAYLLGGLALAATAWLTFRLFLRLSPSRTTAALLTGLLCAVEWHLVWAAASGMETMLFTALSLALLEYYFGHMAAATDPAAEGPASLSRERAMVRAVGIGLLGGVLTLTRPEGLGLASLVIGASAILPIPRSREAMRPRLLAAGLSLVALCIILVPYVGFNLKTSGSIFPNTFYAKQAEYHAQLQALSLPLRFWHMLSPTLIGAQVLLFPGFCYAIYRLLHERRWVALLPLTWWLAFLSVYALRLPASYQHGRYVMPSIPLFILYGSWGTVSFLRPGSSHLGLRVLSRAAGPALALLALAFLARGALAYRDDVGFIEGEMVATAHWLNQNTDPGDLIAVHDIGAVGYLTDRPLLDLAGLITPEVIPFISDADRLAGWMVQRGAAYAVFFPDFSPTYAQLAVDPRFRQVHCTDYLWTRTMGQQNMCVYHLVSKTIP
jgi:arabinofuranosyltransferase